jgi:hypothetical protein
MTIFYSLRFETPPTRRAGSRIYIPPKNRVAQLYPQTLGSLFVASTTRSPTVEVFEPAFTRDNWRSVKVKIKVTLRLEIYRQSVHLDVKPLENHDQIFFQLIPCGNSPYVISSLSRRCVCLLWICLAFRQAYVSHLKHATENSSFCIIYKSSVSTGFAMQIMPILRMLFYNSTVVTWTVVSLGTDPKENTVAMTSVLLRVYSPTIFPLLRHSLLPRKRFLEPLPSNGRLFRFL